MPIRTTKDERVAVPAWLWGLAIALVIGLVGWAGAAIIDHGNRISTTETKVEGVEKKIDRIETGVDKLVDRLLDNSK